VGDLNGDGKLDVVIGGERETVYVNLGSRQFKQTGNFQPGFHSDSIVIADINHDGKGDVISVSQHEAVLNILYGNGDGTLDDNTNDIVTYGLSGGATDLQFIDVNGDGIPDAIVSYAGSPAISVLIGTADGHFLARTDSTILAAVDHIVATHLNNTGDVDLVGVSSASSTVVLFYGNPGIALGTPAVYPVGTSPTGIAVGDLNGDGHPDLVTANTVDNTISVLLGSTNGNYGSRTDFSVGTSPRRVRLADFNDDGHLDAATANSGSSNVTVLLGTGTGIFGAQTRVAAGTSPTDLAVANLNGAKDGKGNPIQDIAVADPGSGQVITLINSGTGTFTPGISLAVNGTPFAIAAGNLEGNGNQDLVVTEATGNKIAVLHNDGAGNFSLLAEYPVGSSPQAVTVGDFNNAKDTGGNPILDIAVANFGDGTVTVLLNNGSGVFTVSQTVTIAGKGSTSANQVTSVQPVAMITADMTGDGLLDLITTNNEGTISVLFSDGTGHFNSQSTLTDSSGPAESVAADMNGDGRLDLATADKTTSVVAVRLTSATNAPIASDIPLIMDTKNISFVTGTFQAISPTNGSLTFQILSTPANGKVVLQDATAGTFTYTPNSNFTGTDSFTYEALNGSLPSNQATVTIVVTNSGSGAYGWLLLVLLAAFVACRKLMTRPRGPSGATA
ncbi:MAG: FG-GAP-like repeat-containing protein, partial [Gammaproteobacteria bacterium]